MRFAQFGAAVFAVGRGDALGCRGGAGDAEDQGAGERVRGEEGGCVAFAAGEAGGGDGVWFLGGAGGELEGEGGEVEVSACCWNVLVGGRMVGGLVGARLAWCAGGVESGFVGGGGRKSVG